MRNYNQQGLRVGAIKNAARGAANRDYRREVAELQPKFHPGADPLEREAGIRVLQPTDAQQLEQMTKMLEKLYAGAGPEQQQALALWKMQVAQGTIRDQVKLDFMRRFYFWLLGRGDQADHDKTLWGRGNTAVYNKQVASYIDMFVDKRTKYIMKLRALANTVPDTLNGFYLYFKYITNGRLKQIRAPDGTLTYDMTEEDYLEDFDLFQQVFDGPGGVQQGYKEIAAGLPTLGERGVKAFDSAGVPAPVNASGLKSGAAAKAAISREIMEQNNIRGVSERLSIEPQKKTRIGRAARGWEQEKGDPQVKRKDDDDDDDDAPPDLANGSTEVSGPPQNLGQAGEEASSISGADRRDSSFIGNDPNATLAEKMPALEEMPTTEEIEKARKEEEEAKKKKKK